jgi:hypothetical protein
MSKSITIPFTYRRVSVATCVVAAVAAFVMSVTAVTPSAAAIRHGTKKAPSADARIYDYGAAGKIDPPGLTAGQLGYRVNPVVPHNAFGPPDPASCGGFNC